jgi:DNA mismatch repair protein MutS
VVERSLPEGLYVPNDLLLGGDAPVGIITGPNMAGKSTYMRQAALITVMAQIGSFVPAKSARLGVVDRVFTRIGAQDDLAGGRSTFMVEMSEVADVLKNATPRSLLILDEIGRGTSTYDGMSVARAVLEHIARKLKAKTLFATHYHELTELESVLPGVRNYNIAVKKRGDEILFLRRVVPGGADDSFGVEVAKMAGLPERVIARAKEILRALEEGSPVAAPRRRARAPEAQLSLSAVGTDALRDRLRQLDLDALSPRDALTTLYELKELTAGK